MAALMALILLGLRILPRIQVAGATVAAVAVVVAIDIGFAKFNSMTNAACSIR
jgi:hypothetical protein